MISDYFEIDGKVFKNVIFTDDIVNCVNLGMDFKKYIAISSRSELSGTTTLSGIIDAEQTKVSDFSINRGENYACVTLESEFTGLNDTVVINSLGLTDRMPPSGGARVFNHAKVIGGVSPKDGKLRVRCVLYLRAESGDGVIIDIEKLASYMFFHDGVFNIEARLHGEAGEEVRSMNFLGGYDSVRFDGFVCDVIEIPGLAVIRSKVWETFDASDGFLSGSCVEARGSDLRFDGAFENGVQLERSAVVLETAYSGRIETAERPFYRDILNSQKLVLGNDGGCAYSHSGNLYFADASGISYIDSGECGNIKDFAITSGNVLVALMSEPPYLRAFNIGGGFARVNVSGGDGLGGVDSLYITSSGGRLMTKKTIAQADIIDEYQATMIENTLVLALRDSREFKRVRIIASAESPYRIYADLGAGSVGIYTGAGVSAIVQDNIKSIVLAENNSISIADKYITVKGKGARVFDIISGDLIVDCAAGGGYADICRSPKYFIKNSGGALELSYFNAVTGALRSCFTMRHSGAHLTACVVVGDVCAMALHDGSVRSFLMPIRHIAVKVGKLAGREYFARFSKRKFYGAGVRVIFKDV